MAPVRRALASVRPLGGFPGLLGQRGPLLAARHRLLVARQLDLAGGNGRRGGGDPGTTLPRLRGGPSRTGCGRPVRGWTYGPRISPNPDEHRSWIVSAGHAAVEVERRPRPET